MKAPLRTICSGLFLVGVTCSVAGGETITVDGVVHRNAEMIEVAPQGPAYRTEGGEIVILPWSDASEAQISGVKQKWPDAIDNAIFEAYYIKGTVFQPNDDGHIIQITLDDDGSELDFKNGAVVLKSGLVIVADVPTSVPQAEGAEIEVIAHKRRTYTYNIGIAAKEIPYLTVARPLWGQEQEWINSDGQKMFAKLLAVKDGKGLFEKGGQQFVYELDKLDDEGRKRAAEIAEKLAGFPLR